MDIVRRASHAGTWYTANANKLGEELDAWLRTCGQFRSPDVRGVIAPHAGYRYSGRCAAFAFAHIDPQQTSRVFLLGPSHRYRTQKCALSSATIYQTPLGDLHVDLEVYKELKATGEFQVMGMQVDEAEHSMEMHLPYLAKVFHGHPVKIIPILVGSISSESEAIYGRLLAKYADDPTNFFSISSDFCHWGQRFKFLYHDKKEGSIYKSIEALDMKGMDLIASGDPIAFNDYISQYGNTICGRHAIGVFLHVLQNCSTKMKFKFVQYEQSGQCKTVHDSSVSYASAVARVET